MVGLIIFLNSYLKTHGLNFVFPPENSAYLIGGGSLFLATQIRCQTLIARLLTNTVTYIGAYKLRDRRDQMHSTEFSQVDRACTVNI